MVWVVAIGGRRLGKNFAAEAIEPYLQLFSATIIVGVALWMIWRTRRDQILEREGHGHDRHDHHHGDEVRMIETGHGLLSLEIFEHGVPPRWRIRCRSGHGWHAEDVKLTTERPDDSRQAFAFVERDGFLESIDEISEPHDFVARLSLGHGGHRHNYDVVFVESGHVHDHDHMHEDVRGLSLIEGGDYTDAHERAHADDINRRFRDRKVTTGQIILFGLTGGLIPCPAAITVLLLCLQLKQLALGVALVACFSIGLAVTMVSAGVIASLSVRQVQKRWSGFGAFARRAPYASGALMLFVALYMGASGWAGLASNG